MVEAQIFHAYTYMAIPHPSEGYSSVETNVRARADK